MICESFSYYADLHIENFIYYVMKTLWKHVFCVCVLSDDDSEISKQHSESNVVGLQFRLSEAFGYYSSSIWGSWSENK